MRWKAVALVAMLLVSGCISGDESAGDPEELETREANESAEQNAGSANASNNSTYLKNDNYREAHVHDYWPGNASEKILMDETISTNFFASTLYTAVSPLTGETQTGVGRVYFTLPNGSFVPEGTGKLIVEVDATSALHNGQQSFAYNPANAELGAYTWTDAQGAEATWEIEVEPQMVDRPHSKSTDWYFQLKADGAGSLLDGDINVKITAEKTRSIEEWPDHPDFWDGGNKTTLHLANINTTFDRTETFAHDLLYFSEVEEQPEPITFPEGTLVPPETEVLLLKLWWAMDDDPRNNLNYELSMSVKPGNSAGYYGQFWNEIQEDDRYKMYAIPVGSDSWDSPYADESSWAMRLEIQSGTEVPVLGGSIGLGNTVEAGSGNATVDATAFREVPPWLEEMMAEEGIGNDGAQARSR